MSDSLILRKGQLANLEKAEKIPGAISITTDERAMYLDLDTNTRIRIGDFIQVDSIADLTVDGQLNSPDFDNGDFLPWSTTAFYYAIKENALLKWNKPEGQSGYWVQVNESGALGENADFTNLQNAINALDLTVTQINNQLTSKQDTITGAASTITNNNLDSARVVITDAEGKIIASNITSATLQHLDVSSSLSQSLSNLSSDINTENIRATQEEGRIREEIAAADNALKNVITTEYKAYIDNQLQVADAMSYKGVVTTFDDLGVIGNEEGLPVQSGWTYKVSTQFPYFIDGEMIWAYVGDLFIAHSDQEEGETTYTGAWDHVHSGYEDDYDVSVKATSNTGTIDIMSAANVSRGSIKFNVDDAESNIVAEITSVVNPETSMYDNKVNFKMVWGEF